MTSTDPCLREREQLLRKLHLTVMSEFLVNSGSEPIPGSMLAYLRLFRMRKPELMHWLKSDRVNDLKQPDCPLDTAINDKVKKTLIYVLESFIARYPTTLQVKKIPFVTNKRTMCSIATFNFILQQFDFIL